MPGRGEGTGATTVATTACPLDCPDACSVEVRVEDGRVVGLGAGAHNPLTAGFLCGKVRRFDRHLYHPSRLATPLVREAGSTKGEPAFRRASWDEALALVADRLRAARDANGGESILPLRYGGSNGKLTDGCVDEALWARLGTSRQLFTVCAMPTSTAANGLYGGMPGVAFDDYAHAELIVVWGANPHASHIHLVPHLKRARANGTRLVVVDPRSTKAAKAADLHLALRPGTDVVLALAVHRWLFEEGRADDAFLRAHATGVEELRRRAEPWTLERAAEVCGVERDAIGGFAELFAAASPAVVRCGWGLERNRNGGSAAAAVLALPCVGGKFGVRGGGFTMSHSSAYRFRTALHTPERPTREIDMNRLGRALLAEHEQPVDVLFVYDANPLMTLPEQELVRRGLGRTDLFTVVFDQVLTDTARYADVVLPATTFLEHHDLRGGYGAYVVHHGRPVIEPVGEARPNYAVFAELLRRLDLWREDDTDDPEELMRRALDDETRLALERDGVAPPMCGAHPVAFSDVFPATPDGKVNLVPAALDAEAPYGLYAYQEDPGTEVFPLALISPATERTISSTFGQLHTGTYPLGIHPSDAADRAIMEGALVRVHNASGEVVTTAHLDADLRPGVVELSKGLWSHNTRNGATACALAPDTAADLGRGACFNDARVEVQPLG